MKKISVFASLVITSIPFTFVKMKGPFTPGYEENFLYNPSKCIVVKIDENKLNNPEIINSIDIMANLWLYNKQTGYTLSRYGYLQLPLSNSDIENLFVNFMAGVSKFKKIINTKQLRNFCLSKEKPDLKLNQSVNDWKKTNISKFFLRYGIDFHNRRAKGEEPHIISESEFLKNNPNPNIQAFFIESIKTDSGIAIDQQDDKITLKKSDGSSKDFYQALSDYYEKPYEIIRDRVAATNKGHISIENKSTNYTYKIKASTEQLVKNEPSRKLLKKSTLLCVYAVLKGEKGKDSIILGLAKNNQTNKNFHWLVDLENKDISTL